MFIDNIKRIKKFCFCTLGLLMISITVNAIDTVTLTTSGIGKTRQDAINNALRSAVEQAYGAFMSSATIEVNDLLVEDEIISISQGNIQSYQVLGEVVKSDDNISVSCKSIISLNKLLEYVQNTGAQVTFSGSSFSANVQLEKLNRENEYKALQHLVKSLATMDNLCDYDLQIEEPDINSAYQTGLCAVRGTILLKINANTINYGILLYNTLAALHVDNNSRKDLHSVPNLGRFKLRNSLPTTLWNDLNEHNESCHWANGGLCYDSHPEAYYAKHIFFKKLWDFAIVEIDNKLQERLLGSIGELRLTRDTKANHWAYNFMPYSCLPSANKNRICDYGYNREKTDIAKVLYLHAATRNDLNNARVPIYSQSRAATWQKKLITPFIYSAYDGEVDGYRYGFYTNDYANIGDVFAEVKFELNYTIDEMADIIRFEVRPMAK